MNFLKSLALSLLSLLLFLSLSLFSTVYMLDSTLLDPDFVAAEINRLDMPAMVGDIFKFETATDTSQLDEAINKTITELEPWIKQEADTAIHSSYDYFLGRTEEFSLIISAEPVRSTLKENIIAAFLASPPPELKGRPQSVIRQYADEAYQQLARNIPQTIEFTENSIPSDIMSTMKQVRSYLRYYQTAYYALIGLMVLFALGIILVSRDVKHSTRSIGTTILVYGVIGYAIMFVLDYFHVVERIMEMMGNIPAWLDTWMPQFMENVMAPLETFGLALLIAGVVLIIISIVYRRRQPQPA